MNSILFLLIGFAISFAGSVPPGAVSLSLIQVGKERGRSVVICWAFWASFIESFQLIAALYLHFELRSFPSFEFYARPLAALLLVVMGIRLLRKTKAEEARPTISFPTFISLNVFNAMAIPFWLGALQFIMLPPVFSFTFIIGSFLGAWLCLAFYGLLGSGLRHSRTFSLQVLNRSIGWTMLVFSFWQSSLFLQTFIGRNHFSHIQILSRL